MFHVAIKLSPSQIPGFGMSGSNWVPFDIGIPKKEGWDGLGVVTLFEPQFSLLELATVGPCCFSNSLVKIKGEYFYFKNIPHFASSYMFGITHFPVIGRDILSLRKIS